MATIEKNVPLPITVRKVPARPLNPLSKEILDALGQAEIGDSFLVDTDYKRAALVGGRMAARLGCSVKTAAEGTGARVWKVAAKVKKAVAAE